MLSDKERTEIKRLLVQSGTDISGLEIKPCTFSGNNRVFVAVTDKYKFVVKRYYDHPSDSRDRLNTEYTFSLFAAQIGIKCIPKPLFSDPENKITLFEFIEGRKIAPKEVCKPYIDQAIEFFIRLNDPKYSNLSKDLPDASDSGFSIEEHIQLVEKRIEKIVTLKPENETDAKGLDFGKAMESHLLLLKKKIIDKTKKCLIDMKKPLLSSERCISPSDFGYHNALLRLSGDLCFLDFEYAGWDDPAKMVGDFFSQPAVPVNQKYFDYFLKSTMGIFKSSAMLIKRAHLLYPLIQMKWCCILMNDFLPDDRRRRKYANPEIDEENRKVIQLQKAKELFSKLEARV